MSETPTARAVDHEVVQRRTVRVLMSSVIPAGMAMAGGFAGAAVLAEEITGSDTLAGLAAATHSVGGALATVPLARLAARRGRRPGLRTGWGVAAIGAALAFAAAIADLYPLLLLGVLGVGVGNATNLSARYAAADLAPEGRQARAIGLLVWAVTVGSVLGPTLALGPAGGFAELIGLPELAGPYLLSAVGFAVAATLVERFLRPDPLEVAGSIDVPGTRRPPVGDSFRALWRSRTARLAVFTMGVGQAVMVGVMTMTPLHMKDGDHELRVIGFVISVHILGMYACSPIVGWLVDRLGPHLVIAAGGVTLFVGAEMASHTDPEDRLGIFIGLFLIGLGWSFGLISASALLAGANDVTDRVAVQGAADLVMVGSGAAAGLVAGVIVEWTGFHTLAHWAGVVALSVIIASARSYFTRSSVPSTT